MVGYSDECMRASEMLNCGMKTVPNITGNMITAGMGSEEIVYKII